MTRDALDGIAIIGMAGRFPKAPNLQRFWENLSQGIESVSFFSEQELEQTGISPDLLRNPNYVRAGAALEDADFFDAGFFGYSPREAELTDPQIRLFLECAWQVLESAGWNPEKFPGMIGVYAGMSFSSYIWQLAGEDTGADSVSAFRLLMGGAEKDHLATTVSYRLNLRGPSLNIQTACSTSLVAVHAAARAVMTYECDMAIAGGSTVNVPQRVGYLYEPGGIASVDGHCRSFDAEASGSLSGDGVGVVLLKRLEDAVAAGDTVYAVIKGSAINNDGRRKVGFTAPAVEGQAEVIALALAAAEVECDSIGYVEAHGSATPMGDPIEIAALNQVYGHAGLKPGSIAVGSVKSNLGHLNSAAGVAGLLKTILSLRHGSIPASLNFRQPNPGIPFGRGPFRVNQTLTPWPHGNKPRRAGVSSFGIGGTNVHVILEEAPETKPSEPAKPWQLITISARSRQTLERATDQLAAHLLEHQEQNFADVAFTLQEGRKAFEHRRMAVCRDAPAATGILQSRTPSHLFTAVASSRRRPVAFLFPGLGDQYLDMGRGLYESEPEFARHVDHCSELLQPLLRIDLRKTMYPDPRVRQQNEVRTEERLTFRDLVQRAREDNSPALQEIHRTLWAQPALFVIEYALAKLWMSWGIVPESMMGYSIGEYVAACLAGVISLEDSLRMLAIRAQRIEALAPGAMLAIAASEEEVRPLLPPEISIAGINGRSLCVVAGTPEAVDALQQRLVGEGELACRRLLATHAFHSPLMAPVAEELTGIARSIRLSAPKIPYISNVTGKPITDAEATDATYWARHLTQPVQFAAGLQHMCTPAAPVFLEIGPGQMLTSLAEQYLAGKGLADRVTLASLPHASDAQPDRAFILSTLGNLWLAGIEPDWAGVHRHERRSRVLLPTYPFERQRYWLTPRRRPQQTQEATTVAVSFAQETVSSRPEYDGVENSRSHLGAEFVAPGNSTEQKIAEIWEELLGIHPIGIHDEFLRLGGNSLLAIRVAAELREAFQIEFPLEALLKSPTVSDIAVFVEDALLTMIENMDESELSGMEANDARPAATD
ncbi:MAG TPA: beta-ketoacyl synthase N-terminal-like domain-containing protein [Candidatus Angelobacter sp.]|jgi:acyl transferase domain-containing protein|nr:beta-ketoacyl synthase N-terminal-like domain-containing protein [Candidatus Angelobacter sp.]